MGAGRRAGFVVARVTVAEVVVHATDWQIFRPPTHDAEEVTAEELLLIERSDAAEWRR